MDKIWDGNPSKSEVIGHCGVDEKTEWPRRTDKSRTLKKTPKNCYYYFIYVSIILKHVFLTYSPFQEIIIGVVYY